MDEILHPGDQPVHVRRLRIERLAAREGEQAVRQGRRALRGALRGRDVTLDVSDPSLRDPGGEQLQAADNPGQQVVEVVRDAARELADRLHLLRLAQGILGDALLGDVPPEPVQSLLLGDDRPGNRAASAGFGGEDALEFAH